MAAQKPSAVALGAEDIQVEESCIAVQELLVIG